MSFVFFIWKWTSIDVSVAPWWWIYPLFFFAATFSVHKYIFTDGSTYKGIYIIFGIANVTLFFTNFVMDPLISPSPWFLYPLFLTFMICIVIHHFQSPITYSLLKLLTHEYILFNIMLFATWLLSPIPRGFPWFFYPLLILAFPLLTLYIKRVYKESRHWIYMCFLCIDICLICFIAWVLTDVWFPWFLVVWAALGLITFYLWYSNRGNSRILYTDISNNQPENSTENETDDKKSIYPIIV